MFNWLRRKSKLNEFVNLVHNVSTSALSGADLFKFMFRQKNYNTLNRGLTLSAVYCALNIYSSSISTLPRSVSRLNPATGKVTRKVTSISDSHPGVRIFLNYANPTLSANNMMVLIANDLLIDGNFYALREFDSQGRTFRLHYIHPSRIPRGNINYTNGTERDTSGKLIPANTLAYRIETGESTTTPNSQSMYVVRDHIVHLQSSIPDTDYNRGCGIVENANRSLNFYENSEEYGNKFYQNGTNSQTYLSTDQKLSEQVLSRLEKYFDNNPNAPLESAFKSRVLDWGLKPVNAAIPLAQLQFIETRAFSIEDVGRWFDIPPELLHSRMGGKTEPGSMGELINLFVQFGIGPLLSRIAQSLKEELFPLTSQQLYQLEFERIYLYRTVINEFSQAIRNLFEIGVLDRAKIADMIGINIDPSDKMNTQRYVPTNLMTTGHSLALETKADTANDLLTQQVRKLELDNDNYVSPMDMLQKQAELKPDLKDDKDESPSDENLDKRIRTAKNAFIAVVNGLNSYCEKVTNQKKEKYGENYEQYVEDFVTNKFFPLVSTSLTEWEPIINEVSPFLSISELVLFWNTNGFTSLIERLSNEANS